MAGKGLRHRFLIFAIIVATLAGCSPPIGSIGKGVTGTAPPVAVNGIKAVLINHTSTYAQGERFMRSQLQVFAAINGNPDYQQPIPLDSCSIFIIEPQSTTVEKSVGEEYALTVAGRNTIRVRHTSLGLSDLTITVTAQPGGGNQGGSGLIGEWEPPW